MFKLDFRKKPHCAYMRIAADCGEYSVETLPGITPAPHIVPITKNSYIYYPHGNHYLTQDHVEDARAYLKEHGEKVLYVLELEVPGTSLSTCRSEEFDVNTSTDEVSRRIHDLIPTLIGEIRKQLPEYISELERTLEAARKALTEDDTELAG